MTLYCPVFQRSRISPDSFSFQFNLKNLLSHFNDILTNIFHSHLRIVPCTILTNHIFVFCYAKSRPLWNFVAHWRFTGIVSYQDSCRQKSCTRLEFPWGQCLSPHHGWKDHNLSQTPDPTCWTLGSQTTPGNSCIQKQIACPHNDNFIFKLELQIEKAIAYGYNVMSFSDLHLFLLF